MGAPRVRIVRRLGFALLLVLPQFAPAVSLPAAPTAAAVVARLSDAAAPEPTPGTLAQTRAAVAVAAGQASVALEAFQTAAATLRRAETAVIQEETALSAADAAVTQQHAALGRWALAAYQAGDLVAESPTLYALLDGGDTGAIDIAQNLLARTGAGERRQLHQLQAALEQRTILTQRARQAADLAAAAAGQANAARAARDAAVTLQRQKLVDLELALARSAAQTPVAAPMASHVVGLGRVDESCPGGDVSSYPNGRIPAGLLCPLWSADARFRLRADAAAAFNRMSQSYAQQTGRPLCVADAYRSYADQVQVRAERGSWAARPGYSNHGWGIAVDLCGGVEDFASPAQAWLTSNATLFGWFHPSWARHGGSLPEPWHWEFSG